MFTEIENILEDKIITFNNVGGGCIGNSAIIKTENNNTYFLKTYNLSNSIILTEANSLKELAKSNTIKVPDVIFSSDKYLILEYIESADKKKDFFEIFGQQLAEMHKFNANEHGFYQDNFIGATPQKNLPQSANWAEFYFQNRLLFQYNLALQNGFGTDELKSNFAKLENVVIKLLGDTKEKPALLHGDLWGGNYLVDKLGYPVLIDPAVYYGNRETDLAMTRLFGGFNNEFYSAYNEAFPLEYGWEERINMYKLYHIFNHLNLFGSGYYSQVIELIKYYTA